MIKIYAMKNNIHRKIYIKKIEPFIGKNLIKVIIGQRRVGKSYFLLQLQEVIKLQSPDIPVVYINKEDLYFSEIKDYEDLVKYVEDKRSNQGMHTLFIDEIQDIVQFEKALRHLQSSGIWDIYITGSNAHILSGELATYLSGRYIEINLYSLSYSEFLVFHGLSESIDSFNKFIRYGGLPYLINLELTDEIVFDYLNNIFYSILYRDIISRFNIRNTSFIERLCLYIADNIGQLVSAKRISEYLKSQHVTFSHNIVLDYLQYLQNAFLVFGIRRNDLKGKKILETGEKMYFQDMGLRNSLLGFRQDDISQLLENVVFQHLLINNFKITIGKIDDKEIDFVCEKNNSKLYIQVTLSLSDKNVRSREINNLLLLKDNFRKLIVTTDEIVPDQIDGIEIYNIRKFLTDFPN